MRAPGGQALAAALTAVLALHPAGAMRLLTPVIARQVRREVAQLDALKAILERAS